MKKIIMKRKTTVLTIFVVMVSLQVAIGQRETTPGKTVDYNTVNMPESPRASALYAVGNTQVNTATGIPSINIPLYTYEMDGVKVPISISYNAAGIKVSELATPVGTNWSLEAGGQISRTVRGKTDEWEGWLNPTYTFLPDSWYASYNASNPYTWQNAMKGLYQTGYNGYAKNRDHNPDFFNYSFPGGSGAFIHTPTGAILKERQDGIQITALSDGGTDVNLTANDLNGNTYFFDSGVVEQSSNKIYTSVNGDHTLDIVEWEGDNGFDPISAWKLSDITTKNNKKIYFEYESEAMYYTLFDVSQHITIGYDCDLPPNEVKTKNEANITYDYNTQLIKKIWSPDGSVEVHFNYASDTGLPDDVWKTKLTSIVISDLISGHIKEFRFTYERYSGDPRLKLTSVYEVGYDGSNNEVYLPPYEFSYNPASLPSKESHAQDFFGYFNNATGNNSLVPEIPNIPQPFLGFYNQHSGDRSLNPSTLQNGILTGILYPTGGSTSFEYMPNSINGKYCGGLRVKTIENTDETGTYNRKTYNYSNLKGFNLEDNLNLIIKTEGNTTTYYSNFNPMPGDIGSGFKTGYFYENVTVTSFNGTDNFKEEFVYEENPNAVHRYDYALKSHISYEGAQVLKRVEYINELVGSIEALYWNVLGEMMCYGTPPNAVYLGYRDLPKVVNFQGNYSFMPTQIATTEYLKQGGSTLNPVTTYKEIEYDPLKLLKKEEVTDYRRTRNGFNDYPVVNTNEEKTTVIYKYPWDPTININLPGALPMKVDVVSLKNNNDKIFGQAFEYDSNGNIKKAYQYNKGQASNNSPLSYIPIDYEEIDSFFFQDGKPVQVKNKNGVPISYIYGYDHQYPVAKIENKGYGTIPSGLISAIHSASSVTGTEAQLQTALNNLRNDGSMANAMITTYTYKPLVGVTSITAPNGDLIRYFYDEFGRLDHIIDKYDNLIEEYEYNYGNQ